MVACRGLLCEIGGIKIMGKSSFAFLMLISMPFFISGCVDCMVQGLDARTCSRMKHNAEIISQHQKQTAEFNKSIRFGYFGEVMSPEEIESLLGNVCKRFRDDPLPTNLDTALLGNCYENHFCKLYESNRSLSVRKKEVKYSDKLGSIYFVLTDGNKVLEYFQWPIVYTKKGYMFGSD